MTMTSLSLLRVVPALVVLPRCRRPLAARRADEPAVLRHQVEARLVRAEDEARVADGLPLAHVDRFRLDLANGLRVDAGEVRTRKLAPLGEVAGPHGLERNDARHLARDVEPLGQPAQP